MRFHPLLPLALAACAAAPAAAQANATLDLRVSASAGTPLPNVHVDVLGRRRLGSVTDSHGHVRVGRVPVGTQLVRVQRLGYETQALTLDLQPGDTVQLDLTLATRAIPLDTVTATREAVVPALERNGFYDRRKVGLGHYVTERELSRVPDEPTHSIFRRIPGVDAVPVGNYWILVSTRGPLSPRGIGCPVRLFVDGIPWRDDLDAVQHRDIEAAEVYASPSEIPPQYGGANSACGVVLIWTRH